MYLGHRFWEMKTYDRGIQLPPILRGQAAALASLSQLGFFEVFLLEQYIQPPKVQ